MAEGRIRKALDRIDNDHFKLILVAGGFKTGKTTLLKKVSGGMGYPYINLNLILTKRLMENKESSYATKSQEFLKEIFDEINSETLLVDNVELMFSKEVGCLNPVDVFKNLARDRKIILALPCKVKGEKAEYSTPERSDYMMMDLSGLTVIKMEVGGNG